MCCLFCCELCYNNMSNKLRPLSFLCSSHYKWLEIDAPVKESHTIKLKLLTKGPYCCDLIASLLQNIPG